LIKRSIKNLLRRAVHSIVTLHGSPEAIAMGTAIGVFVAFTPTVGFQMLIGALIATAVGANRPAAIVPAWITTPVTIPPIFALTYWVGRLMLGGPDVSVVYDQLVGVAKAFGSLKFYEVWDHMVALLATGVEVYVPMLVGGIIVGGIAGGITYPLTVRAVRSFRRGKEHLREVRAHRREQREKRKHARDES